jgi:hypothetical protein
MTTITFPKRSQFGRNNRRWDAIESFQQWLKTNVPNFLGCFMLYNTNTTIYFESRMNRGGKVLILRADKEYNLDEKFIQQLNQLIEQDHKLTEIQNQKRKILDSNHDTAVFLQESFSEYAITFTSGCFKVSGKKVYVQIANDSKVHTPKAEVNPMYIHSRMSVDTLVQLAKEVEIETEKLMGKLPEIMAMIPTNFWKA